jgi:hypothetical protein
VKHTIVFNESPSTHLKQSNVRGSPLSTSTLDVRELEHDLRQQTRGAAVLRDELKNLFPYDEDAKRLSQQTSLPPEIAHEGSVVEQHIREGRFQRSLSFIAAFANLLGGLEVTYEHIRGSYGQRIMYTPVILSAAACISSFLAIFNRWVARVLQPITSLLLMLDGIIGFYYHIRGVQRKPGGWRIPIFNVIMGPPIFAPPLLGISGFLGLTAAFLRREDDPEGTIATGALPSWLRWLPMNIRKESKTLAQDIREGRFQRMLAAATAISGFFSGIESLYSHYKNRFTYRMQWTPVLLTPLLMAAGFGAVWNRAIARTLLPFASLLALIDGGIGFLLHVRGILRRPAGIKQILYNIIYGPPIFAPLLFAASGFLGLLAFLLRRER